MVAAKSAAQAKQQTEPVYITMLGSLRLSLGGRVIDESYGRSQKVWNLLAYLIVHRDRHVPQEEIISMLWPEKSSDNPANALKTLLYRLRIMLTPLLGQNKQLIISRRGAYSWNSEFPCIVDAEQFAVLLRQAGAEDQPEESRREYYRRAFAIYHQDFLTQLSGQLWVIPLATYYHNMYVEAAQSYGLLLAEQGQYRELAEICSAALAIEPYHEGLHALLVRALLHQGNNRAALEHYSAATEFFYRNLGIKPSAELRELYQRIMQEENDLELDLSIIQNDLRETAARPGAFVCEYGFFREAYRLEARRAARQGSCLHLVLLTLARPNGQLPKLEMLHEAMEQLLQLLRQNLRRGDIIARYNGAQYVLMLPDANYEDSHAIMERLLKSYQQNMRKSGLSLSYKLTPLESEPLLLPWHSEASHKKEQGYEAELS